MTPGKRIPGSYWSWARARSQGTTFVVTDGSGGWEIGGWVSGKSDGHVDKGEGRMICFRRKITIMRSAVRDKGR